MDYIAGTTIAVPVSFTVDGKPRVPDANSAGYVLYGHSGTQLTTGSITTGAAQTSAIVSIADTHNTITNPFEKRTLVVTWLTSGVPFRTRINYRLTPFLNHTVTTNKVRALLGINLSELPDDDIDILAAYFRVENELGSAVFSAALSAGDHTELAVNDAITCEAALALLPGLQFRFAQRETDGQVGFDRIQIRDWKTVRHDLLQARTAAFDVVLGREGTYTAILVATGTDAITGA
jgi:hypothetical protein